MRRTISSVLAVFLSTGCGIAEHVEGEWDAVAEPRVILLRSEEMERKALVCSTARDPFSLGAVQNVLVSPDGHFAAIQREEGVSILSLGTLKERPLPGENASLDGARWSRKENRLAYLAGGVPWLASADGAWSKALEVELPAPSADYEYQGAEWSEDGQHVAFATRRRGILTDRKGTSVSVFSEKVVGPYVTPWALSFSPDGKTLAALQTEEPEGQQRSLLFLDIPSMTAREVEDIGHYSLFGWASDGSGVTFMDVGIEIWFVPRDGSEPKEGGFPSPTAPELAMDGPGLPIESLRDESVRKLLPDSVDARSVRWEAGGQVIWYDRVIRDERGSVQYVDAAFLRASDGAHLARGSGVVRDDGWAVLVEPEAPEYLVTRDLFAAPESGARIPWDARDDGRFLSQYVQWLEDDRLAFLTTDGVHVARRDGSDERTICPSGTTLVERQPRNPRVW